jgi:hypothetical protein
MRDRHGVERRPDGTVLPGNTANRKGRPRLGLDLAQRCRDEIEKRKLVEKLGRGGGR